MEDSPDIAPPEALADAVARAYPVWLAEQLMRRAAGAGAAQDTWRDLLDEAVRDAAFVLDRELTALLATDVDEQRKNPLQVIREVTATAARVLDRLGVAAPVRDEVEQAAMPDDRHGVGPLAWRDLGEEVHDAGILWGAWKAATVLARRRAEGKLSP